MAMGQEVTDMILSSQEEDHNDQEQAYQQYHNTIPPHPQALHPYLSINLQYPQLFLICQSPPIFGVENFLTGEECDKLIFASDGAMLPSPVVGAGSGEISPQRTSTTCYFSREDTPSLVRKVCCLTNKPLEHLELPQVGRYYGGQQYLPHFDAFDLSTADGQRFALNGGQRVCTVLVYLNDVRIGGETVFPKINLTIQPRRGNAIVFFPATLYGELDPLALHCAQPAIEGYTKWVSQIWVRQGRHEGIPSRRIYPPV